MGNYCSCDTANPEQKDLEAYLQKNPPVQNQEKENNEEQIKNDLYFRMSDLSFTPSAQHLPNNQNLLLQNQYQQDLKGKRKSREYQLSGQDQLTCSQQDFYSSKSQIQNKTTSPQQSIRGFPEQPSLRVMEQVQRIQQKQQDDQISMGAASSQHRAQLTDHDQKTERTVFNYTSNKNSNGGSSQINSNRKQFQQSIQQQWHDYYLSTSLLDTNDSILFQGELLKLKPGVKFEFQQRWVQVTSNALRYYKARWTQNSGLVKPLGAIPIKAIERIQILETDTVKIHALCSVKQQFNFEIVLKENFLDLYLDPYYDIQLSEDKANLNITMTKKKQEMSQFMDSGIDYYSDPIRKDLLIQCYMINTQDPKLAQQTLQNDDQQEDPNQQSTIIGESKIMQNTTKASPRNSINHSPERAMSMKKLSNNTSIMSSIEKKQKMKSKAGKMKTLMSDREEQWFLTDKRLIFASDDQKVAGEWAYKLMQIINKNKESYEHQNSMPPSPMQLFQQ